jgi:pyrroloquinoline quinone (PQQ) biosynthesis protein C
VQLNEHHQVYHKFKKGIKTKVHCFFKGHKPILVKWEKVGSKVLSKTTIPNGETLDFKDMKMSDGGVYTCTGSNAFSSYTAHVNVSVFGK